MSENKGIIAEKTKKAGENRNLSSRSFDTPCDQIQGPVSNLAGQMYGLSPEVQRKRLVDPREEIKEGGDQIRAVELLGGEEKLIENARQLPMSFAGKSVTRTVPVKTKE